MYKIDAFIAFTLFTVIAFYGEQNPELANRLAYFGFGWFVGILLEMQLFKK